MEAEAYMRAVERYQAAPKTQKVRIEISCGCYTTFMVAPMPYGPPPELMGTCPLVGYDKDMALVYRASVLPK